MRLSGVMVTHLTLHQKISGSIPDCDVDPVGLTHNE